MSDSLGFLIQVNVLRTFAPSHACRVAGEGPWKKMEMARVKDAGLHTIKRCIRDADTATATYTPPPSSTYYAACGPSNQVSTDYQGRLLELVTIGSGVSASEYHTTNAYDCYSLCFNTPNCYGATYGAGFGQQRCELEVGNTCPANQGGSGGEYSYARTGNIPVTISNGPCGTYTHSESI